jgi:TFIIF-interacting CTD phosphatase-like protein
MGFFYVVIVFIFMIFYYVVYKKKQKKLLVLDVNGVLIHRIHKSSSSKDDVSVFVRDYNIWKRPHLNEFLEFCFENFQVSIWSSMQQKNAIPIINEIFTKDQTRNLEFIFYKDQCDEIKPHPNPNVNKPSLWKKDLLKIWKSFPQFSVENTLIIDDCKYKMLGNPKKCVIIPTVFDKKDLETDIGLLKLTNELKLKI